MSFLPFKDKEYLKRKNIEFEEVSDGKRKVVIFKNWSLPEGKYDYPQADVMIILPFGYPDASPDMFYCLPWLKIVVKHGYPSKANVGEGFGGQNWQRWSRHWKEWRPGTDGMRTMIKRIEREFKVAS